MNENYSEANFFLEEWFQAILQSHPFLKLPGHPQPLNPDIGYRLKEKKVFSRPY